MNANMLCSKCGKRPAVVFISKIQGDDSTQEGLCLKCAMDMNIGPIKQFMEKMGITEEEVEAVAESFLACCIASLLTYTGVTTTDCFSICSKSSLGNNCA